MEEREEITLYVPANGRPIGRVCTALSTTCQFEGPMPDWMKHFSSEAERKREQAEATWHQLPPEIRAEAHKAAYLLGTLLYKVGAQGLSIDAMAAGQPHTLTITLNKKNAD